MAKHFDMGQLDDSMGGQVGTAACLAARLLPLLLPSHAPGMLQLPATRVAWRAGGQVLMRVAPVVACAGADRVQWLADWACGRNRSPQLRSRLILLAAGQALVAQVLPPSLRLSLPSDARRIPEAKTRGIAASMLYAEDATCRLA